MNIATLLEGITVGVSAGLVLGVLHWLTGKVQAKSERGEQIRHLARTIEQYREMIHNASDLDFADHPLSREVSRDQIRNAYLQWLHREIQQILVGRAGRLSFDEIRQIRQAFSMVQLYPNWVPNDQGYDQIFGRLESVGWLELEQRK